MFEILKMILTGTVHADFVDIGEVTIKLTSPERRELAGVFVKGFTHPWLTFADCMSPELEDLLCGYRPERYRKEL